MANLEPYLVRDGAGMSYVERMIRDEIRSGAREIRSDLVQVLLSDLSNFRAEKGQIETLRAQKEGLKEDLVELEELERTISRRILK